MTLLDIDKNVKIHWWMIHLFSIYVRFKPVSLSPLALIADMSAIVSISGGIGTRNCGQVGRLLSFT